MFDINLPKVTDEDLKAIAEAAKSFSDTVNGRTGFGLVIAVGCFFVFKAGAELARDFRGPASMTHEMLHRGTNDPTAAQLDQQLAPPR